MKKHITVLAYLLLINLNHAFIEGHPESTRADTAPKVREVSGLERLKRIRDTLNSLKNSGNSDIGSNTPSYINQSPLIQRTNLPASIDSKELPVAPSPFVVDVVSKPNVANKPITTGKASIVGLLEKCQKLGGYMQTKTSDQNRAFELYKTHCFAVISQVAIPQNLDLLYPLQTAYLDWIGDHAQSNQYHTLLYQLNPNDLHINISFARNLKNLGELAMATELLNFYKESPGAKKLEDSDRRLLMEVESELSNPEMQ